MPLKLTPRRGKWKASQRLSLARSLEALIAVSRAQPQLDVLAQIFPNYAVIAMKHTYFTYEGQQPADPGLWCGQAQLGAD